MNRYRQQTLFGLAGAFILATADAQQPTETVEKDGAIRTTPRQRRGFNRFTLLCDAELRSSRLST